MGKKYFEKKGFVGLTNKSKLIDVGVFLGTLLIGWFFFNADIDSNSLGVIMAVTLALVIAWVVQIFLPRDTYYYTEHFCADCGQYLGYSPKTCSRCGCNRYTKNDSGVGRTVRSR